MSIDKSAPSTAPWFYVEGGHKRGPVQLDELVLLIDTASIPRSALVWRHGLTGWMTAESLPEIAELLPPPLPVEEEPPPFGGEQVTACGACGGEIRTGASACVTCGVALDAATELRPPLPAEGARGDGASSSASEASTSDRRTDAPRVEGRSVGPITWIAAVLVLGNLFLFPHPGSLPVELVRILGNAAGAVVLIGLPIAAYKVLRGTPIAKWDKIALVVFVALFAVGMILIVVLAAN